jgi:outer membrane lipoprotein SlyB
MVDINTQTVQRESDSRGQRTAKVAGGTAAVGAVIGAIAGGGKGAAIGAGAGAAAGTGVQVVTKGQRVQIPSETRLTFTTDTDVQI